MGARLEFLFALVSDREMDDRLRQYEEKKKRRADNARWVITFVVWGAGGYGLGVTSQWLDRHGHDALAELVNGACFFYVFLLFPIHSQVRRLLGDY